MADAHLLQTIEIAQQRFPLRHDAGLTQQVFQVFLHGERQERTKYVSANSGVGGMEDRTRAHDRLGAQEQVLDQEQVAVAHDHLQWRELGIGAQHEDAVEAGFLGEPASISKAGWLLPSRVLRR